MIRESIVKKVLLENNILKPEELEEILGQSNRKKSDFITYLITNKTVTENQIYNLIAKEYGIPYIDLRGKNLDNKLLELLPENIVQTHQVVIFEQNTKKNTIKVATTDPEDLQTIDFIKKKTNSCVEIFFTSTDSIQSIVQQYHKGLEQEFAQISTLPLTDSKQPIDKLNLIAQDVPIIKIMDTLLEYAIFEGASDIHIEPTEKEIIIRYRIDGILRDVMSFPKSLQAGLIARVKVLANLKLDEHRLPQDGRFKIENDQFKVAFRVSIIPVFDGEKIVLRLLDESKQILTLEQLGILEEPLEILKRNIKKPHGMILVTGPTGSGKTTTLYTAMNILNTPKVNISTVEDPIEYRMPRVNQSQINPKIGFTFAMGLRALLRQDPNIIMVGEIRDQETAEIATHAAMTGHLVLSTLHTNDAAGAIPRLSEMGVANFLIASTVNIIIAQRLVRKICIHCIQSYTLSKKDIQQIEKQFAFQHILDILEKHHEIPSDGLNVSDINFFRGVGCARCNHTGYKGRVGIYEILEVDQELAGLISKKELKREEVYEHALKKNLITIPQDGFIKAKRGIISIEEVLRVTKE
ncbi:MAG: ATPase, T2SS/T4P/T4SS family [Patescibacteria group bacterium]